MYVGTYMFPVDTLHVHVVHVVYGLGAFTDPKNRVGNLCMKYRAELYLVDYPEELWNYRGDACRWLICTSRFWSREIIKLNVAWLANYMYMYLSKISMISHSASF